MSRTEQQQPHTKPWCSWCGVGLAEFPPLVMVKSLGALRDIPKEVPEEEIRQLFQGDKVQRVNPDDQGGRCAGASLPGEQRVFMPESLLAKKSISIDARTSLFWG